jgi:RNA polymerase sigma-70 factor (ECF subfamily)
MQKSAFAEIVHRWQRELFQFFRLLGADAHQAEDCVQETFLRLYAYRDHFEASLERGFSVLIYRIARNVRVDALRKTRRTLPCLPLGPEALAVPRHGPRDGGSIAWDERLDLESALLALPEKLRAVVVLNVFQGLTYREISGALGIPLGTVKSRMSLAILRLRKALHAESQR